MKHLFLKFLILGMVYLLSACNGCWTPMPVVSCGSPQKKSNVDSYTKKGILQEQKNSDIKECLGIDYGDIPDKYGSIAEALRKKYPHSNDGWKKVRAFDSCMKNKGYIFDDK